MGEGKRSKQPAQPPGSALTGAPPHLGDLVGAVPVEAAERNGAVDDRGVKPDLLDEAGAPDSANPPPKKTTPRTALD